MNSKKQQFVDEFFARYEDLATQPQNQLTVDNFSLDNIEGLLAELDHPEGRYPSIHIAGTNGKGSVSALCASCLEAQGYKVGLYTSPHLAGRFEGTRVDGQKIELDEVIKILKGMKPKLDAFPGITSFEIITSLTFLYFYESEVDVAVIEVGLGGSLDATNVISPLVSVITPIDLEHRSILGNSFTAIAQHKAGIIKEDRPVVIAPQTEAARQVLLNAAKSKGANLIEVGRDVHFERQAFDFERQSLSIWYENNPKKKVQLEIGLHGLHQAENAATAYASLKAANDQGLKIATQAIREGFAEAHWPGRFEILQGSPTMVLDAAHTPAASLTLAQALEDYFPGKPIVALLGISGDKDLEALLAPIKNLLSQVVATQSGQPRAMDASQIAMALQALGIDAAGIADPAKALQKAKELLAEDGLLVVFGSVFLVERIHQLVLLKSEKT